MFGLPKAPPNLRPHQVEAFNSVFSHLARGIQSQMVQMATGGGKTFLAVAIAEVFPKGLFIVPTQELLHQSKASYEAVSSSGEKAGIIWRSEVNTNNRFTVATIQSLYNRMHDLDPYTWSVILVDEAHGAAAKNWRAVTEYFQPSLLLGLSATPERLDGAPLNAIFDVQSYALDIKKAVHAGILVKPKAMQVHTNVDIGRVGRNAGDFNQAELNKTINTDQRNKIILDTYLEHARGRKTVGFTAGIAHARELQRLFQAAGISAESVAGSDRDRAERIARFENGDVEVLFNASLLTEGWDYPPVDCVLMCRPTQSRALYVQCVGRGLRLHPGKTDCLIIDFHDSSRTHRLAGIWDFWGAKRKNRRLREPTDLIENDENFEENLELLEGAWNVEAYVEMLDVLRPPPDIPEVVVGEHNWHRRPASEKQLGLLKNLGYDTNLDWSRGQASAVISQQPASLNQLKLLLAYNYDTLSYQWTRSEATAAIHLAQNANQKPDFTIFNKLLTRRHQ